MENFELLKRLSDAVCIGNLKDAALIAKSELQKYAEVSDFGTAGIIAKIDGGCERTLLLDAHIDEVGFVVTSVFEDGFLKVAAVGGIDPRILPDTRVTVHGKDKVDAVFTSTPPHLAKNESEAVSLDDILLDTGLGADAANKISVGDYVTFKQSFSPLLGSRVTGKSLDDRAAVYCLLELAKKIHGKPLSYNLIISLSEQEELGTRGAVTAAFASECDEAVAIDVSFGNQPGVSPDECGRLGDGVMIGISPVLNKKMTDRFISLAEEKGIPHQFEVMGGRTGTDADVITVSKSGIPTALLSIPLRNMHTPVEVVDTADIDTVVNLLSAYISGGADNV